MLNETLVRGGKCFIAAVGIKNNLYKKSTANLRHFLSLCSVLKLALNLGFPFCKVNCITSLPAYSVLSAKDNRDSIYRTDVL